MLTRARWFMYGSAATLGATVFVASRARAMRERLDAHGIARVSAYAAADGLESVGRRLQRSAFRVAPDGSAEEQE
jgi:hypothetical protein